ncbi:MAG TPA: 50S ribosomal protein L21, partial [Solibacterales bacterium]|nr:50S ribosomal protein L21 [Bryobacterales bacterium]
GEPGTEVQLGRVVAVSNDDGQMLAGAEVASARVLGRIEDHGRGTKVTVFKFKRKK